MARHLRFRLRPVGRQRALPQPAGDGLEAGPAGPEPGDAQWRAERAAGKPAAGGAGAQSGQNSNAGAQAGNTGASNDPSQSAQSGQNGQNGQTQPGQAPPPPQGQAGPTQGQSSSGFGFSGFGQSGLSSGSAGSGFGSSTQPQSLAPLEPVSGPVLGGSLIGVGGKIKMPSLLIWQGGEQDYEWEFIYNPLTNSTGCHENAGTGVATPARREQARAPELPELPTRAPLRADFAHGRLGHRSGQSSGNSGAAAFDFLTKFLRKAFLRFHTSRWFQQVCWRTSIWRA